MTPGNFPQFKNMTQAESLAWMMAPSPQIRLTLTQGTPVTTADVTGATSVFAEPFGGAIVPLFRDTAGKYPCIRKLAPSTLSLALGTLASGTIPNDVFAYDNNGSLGLEKLAWTSTTARATAIDLVDGRYYKNGDYSRLHIGTFAPTATTTTADSALNRYLWNYYNSVEKLGAAAEGTSHAYTTGVWRYWNNSSTNSTMNFVAGLAGIIALNVISQSGVTSGAGTVYVGLGLNVSGAPTGADDQLGFSTGSLLYGGTAFKSSVLGLNDVGVYEYGVANGQFYSHTSQIRVRC